MKLATVRFQGEVLAGVVADENFIAFRDISSDLPGDMLAFIEGNERFRPIVEEGLASAVATARFADTQILAPLPNPRTIRDFVGFEEHAKNSGTHLGMDLSGMLDTWRSAPAYYFSNVNSVTGSDESIAKHPGSQCFDFEFEIGFIIGKRGKNIAAEDANNYIFGMTIFNDWSARDLQMQEIKLGAGTPQAKAYANSLGPVILTWDEVVAHALPDDSQRFDLATKLVRNGELLRENNVGSIYFTFGQMIEHASQHVDLVPGDLFGSGTIGGGCIAEYPPEMPWLQRGDVVEMTLEGIGTLVNTVN